MRVLWRCPEDMTTCGCRAVKEVGGGGAETEGSLLGWGPEDTVYPRNPGEGGGGHEDQRTRTRPSLGARGFLRCARSSSPTSLLSLTTGT